MRIPRLFRLPAYQRFYIEPRYYDPIKEDIAKRKIRIKKQLMREKGLQNDEEENYNTNIAEAFNRKRRTASSSASLMQFFLMVLFLGITIGYIYFGNDALYALLVMIPFYLLIRLKNIY